MTPLVAEIVDAAERLVEAVTDPKNGGLISRDTIRTADELRMLLIRWRKAFRQ